jgi:glyoxylase-like metal-dependent hydrolase (beta-lactamase superfamily II)
MNLQSAIGAAVLAAWPLAAEAAQQFQPQTVRPAADSVRITTTDLGNRTYMLAGEGGNIVLALGEDAAIMVDTMFVEHNDKIRAAIRQLTQLPIRYLVVTHFHRDHTGGNEYFAKDGTVIVAHENTRKHMVTGSMNALTGNVVPPAAAAALPRLTHGDGMMLGVRGREAELKYLHAHTDADTYVYFRDANVLATGDIVTFARFPNIDVMFGGSIDRMLVGLDEQIALADDNTRVVPGHGPLGTKRDMIAYREMLATARARVQKLIDEGKSEDEAVAAKPNADYNARLPVTELAANNFVRVVYRSLKR